MNTAPQRRARQLVALLGDAPGSFRFVGVLHSRHQTKMGCQLAGIGKIFDRADSAQQYGGADRSDTLDADQVLVSGQVGAFLLLLLRSRLLALRTFLLLK